MQNSKARKGKKLHARRRSDYNFQNLMTYENVASEYLFAIGSEDIFPSYFGRYLPICRSTYILKRFKKQNSLKHSLLVI
jgi:hypothetical protein